MEAQRDQYVSELESASMGVFGEELSTLSEVEERLAAVEGADLTAQLPDRGAFEVLEMITRAAAPSDAGQAAGQAAGAATVGAPGAVTAIDPNGVVTGTNPDGSPAMFDATGNPLTGPTAPPAPGGEDEGEEEEVGAGPIDPSAGIVVSDQLIVQRIDIRELKLEMKVEATRSTAQDRLALKLDALGCITDIKKGKVRDSNDKKVFELEMSHSCFREIPGGEDS
jgi:hypothetical protein